MIFCSPGLLGDTLLHLLEQVPDLVIQARYNIISTCIQIEFKLTFPSQPRVPQFVVRDHWWSTRAWAPLHGSLECSDLLQYLTKEVVHLLHHLLLSSCSQVLLMSIIWCQSMCWVHHHLVIIAHICRNSVSCAGSTRPGTIVEDWWLYMRVFSSKVRAVLFSHPVVSKGLFTLIGISLGYNNPLSEHLVLSHVLRQRVPQPSIYVQGQLQRPWSAFCSSNYF